MDADADLRTATRPTLIRWSDMRREPLSPGLSRSLVSGEKAMVAHVYLEKGAIVPQHSHPNEQFTYVLEGALRFRLGADRSQEVVVRAGEILHIPGDHPHEAEALENTLDVDFFAPPRQDWLDKTDTYLRR